MSFAEQAKQNILSFQKTNTGSSVIVPIRKQTNYYDHLLPPNELQQINICELKLYKRNKGQMDFFATTNGLSIADDYFNKKSLELTVNHEMAHCEFQAIEFQKRGFKTGTILDKDLNYLYHSKTLLKYYNNPLSALHENFADTYATLLKSNEQTDILATVVHDKFIGQNKINGLAKENSRYGDIYRLFEKGLNKYLSEGKFDEVGIYSLKLKAAMSSINFQEEMRKPILNMPSEIWYEGTNLLEELLSQDPEIQKVFQEIQEKELQSWKNVTEKSKNAFSFDESLKNNTQNKIERMKKIENLRNEKTDKKYTSLLNGLNEKLLSVDLSPEAKKERLEKLSEFQAQRTVDMMKKTQNKL